MIMVRACTAEAPKHYAHKSLKVLAFYARHIITPKTELFVMSQRNEAVAHLEAGKACCRIVLENDF